VIPFVVVVCLTACTKGTQVSAQTQSPAPAKPAARQSTPAAAGQAATTAGEATPAAAPTAAVKPVPAQLPEVVAKVNGDTITKADFEKALHSAEQRVGQPVPADQRDQVYRRLLDQLVGYRLLVQETKTRNVVVPDAEIDARIGQIRQQFPNEEAFTKALAQQNLSVEKLKADARTDMAVAKMISDEVASKVVVKPTDIDAFYKANQQRFQQPERVHASHILVSVPKDADAAARAKAKAKADDLLKQAREGKDFAELAKANSDDPGSAQNGGDLGFFQAGQMVGPFNDVAFAQKPGTISDVVETDFGYHIIKVIEKQPGGVVPFDEAKGQIQQFLEQQNRSQQAEAFVNALKTKSKVEIFI